MSKENSPFFSIITASFNSEKTIYSTLQSVLNLDFQDYEYIIVDGASKDKTLEIIQSFKPKFEGKGIVLKYVSERDNGIYDAWNKGVKLSSGNWISFLGSDDEYLPNALNKYYNYIKKNSSINYISSRIELVNSKKETLTVFGKPFIWEKVVRNMEVGQVGSFHKRELFDKIGRFNDEYKIVGDLEFYIRCKNVIKPAFFDEVTVKMLNEGVSNQIFKALKEALEVKLKYKSTPVIVSYFDFSVILMKCYLNKLIKKK